MEKSKLNSNNKIVKMFNFLEIITINNKGEEVKQPQTLEQLELFF